MSIRLVRPLKVWTTLFNVSEEESQELLPSGTARVLDNRVGWAKHFSTSSC